MKFLIALLLSNMAHAQDWWIGGSKSCRPSLQTLSEYTTSLEKNKSEYTFMEGISKSGFYIVSSNDKGTVKALVWANSIDRCEDGLSFLNVTLAMKTAEDQIIQDIKNGKITKKPSLKYNREQIRKAYNEQSNSSISAEDFRRLMDKYNANLDKNKK